MNKILSKQQLSDKVFKLEVEAPLIARSRRAGHFVIVRVGDKGERMPLTIADADPVRGTITLVVQEVGLSSNRLCALAVGDSITDVVGPLGQATHIEQFGTVVCAGGGVGVAPMLPIVRALKAAGNRVITVLAARTKELIILEDEMRASSDEVVIMTDDGSYGRKGLVTAGVEEIINREHVDKCFAIGPAIMMKFVCDLTRRYGIPTDVSLNTIMVDGTGMCGACRVTVGGKTRFVCVDGPEFDGHEVDFDEMLKRMGAFRDIERKDMDKLSHTSEEIREAMLRNDDDRTAPWREELRKAMKPKERMSLERVKMEELDPAYRSHNHEEVNRGLTLRQAMAEARRCLDCANPSCMTGCPVAIHIPSFIKNIERGEITEAARVLKLTSALPAVCGRVCPQEKQCEAHCIYAEKLGKPAVAIGYLERFAADYEREHGKGEAPSVAPANGIKVAVVGSGPAGLTFASDMAKRGYDVTVFEALHEIGGVLKYGIPEFRLPNSIVDHEVSNLAAMGVKFVKDCIVGKTITIDDLKAEGFRGFFVASGAGLPRFMGIPGENAINIMSSNEYLTRVNLMDAANPEADTPVTFGRRVVVIGGGNTAMDSVRTARRLGAERAIVVYRRSEAEMPARAEEVKHAKEEGVEFMTLHNPIEYISDEQGRVKQVVLQRMQLGEPDESGRRSPVPIPGATETLDIDMAIVSVGVSPNPIIPNSVEGLEVSRRGTIVVGDDMQSSVPMLYAGGDIVRGGATVILAMGDGRRAAARMHEALSQA
ncbi:MAG TPA: bifunctional dihydroorotate dehydrogenase B NAD binding subunit/NADPH-dependent glutamate synthase [Candidatus Avibacteroides faecavium]|nr:bifunctional dihydroorotate dehydrogenase B NAD binding subunit/NADPH-dependent glutamate synthase [Candidatus Avibacteroides faecavium]